MTIAFDIVQKGAKSQIRFTHAGLGPTLECFDACSDAWESIIHGNLRDHITADI